MKDIEHCYHQPAIQDNTVSITGCPGQVQGPCDFIADRLHSLPSKGMKCSYWTLCNRPL